jgi:hypothetical protein
MLRHLRRSLGLAALPLVLAHVVTAMAAPPTATTASAELPIWQASADLDGDDKPEQIRVFVSGAASTSTQGSPRDLGGEAVCGERPCHVRIEVGAATSELELELDANTALHVKVVQIDRAERRKQLLISRVEIDEEDPPHMYSVGTYTGGKLQLQDLQYGSTREAIIDGHGALVVRAEGCPTRLIVEYRRHGDRLLELKRIEELTRFPDEDCPG